MKALEEVVIRLRGAGLKITPQRLSILKLLQGNNTHPSAEELYHRILKIHPSISFTTVYKTLQTLRDMGEIIELNINPQRAHYDPCTKEHAHTFCRACKRIEDLHDGSENALIPELPEGPEDFEIHNIQIHAVGLCGECK